jgi:diguanylate cyclase (GGDEF)-like protein
VADTSYDEVTGARPRSALRAGLETALADAALAGGAGACSAFLFDVDFFKTVNDVYGHRRGDVVLRQIADRVATALGPAGTVYRYGGDEFVVVLPGATADAALSWALQLTDLVRETPFEGEPPLHLSISLGVATYPADGPDLLAVADRRNYAAKRRGRGGAVADDADAATGDAGTRLWERDAALSGVHDFLTRLTDRRRGALRVTGQPGAGHTRFLEEVRRLATLRGFAVIPAGDAPPGPPPGPVLLLADTGDPPGVPPGWDPAEPDVLGVAWATTSAAGPGPPGLPLLGTVDLPPWSPATQRIWLRWALHGEPDEALAEWVARHSGGLPAAAARTLAGLQARQAVVPAGPGRWSLDPARAAAHRHDVRLPAQLTSLVGRRDERRRVAELLRQSRLVTLVGPGGIGKTRLSVAVADAVADDHGGAVFVALADATTAGEVVDTLARTLDVDEVPGQPLLDGLTEHLAAARLLLVLDNLEQVVDAAAPVLGRLLAAAPGLTVLATSREALDVYGEQVYRVPPLPLPDLAGLPPGADGVSAALSGSAAVALFDQRARAAADDFRLTPASLPAVVGLCRLLDGLPLAIELAAARAAAADPAALLTQLTDHLDALGAGPRDRPDRQQTLRGAVDWSYALLSAPERSVFEAASVFPAGCTPATAAAVLADPADAAGGATLASLARKSLLVTEADPDGVPRYRMLTVIRAYAAERLAARGAEAVRDRHRDHFAALAEQAGTGMAGPEQARWAEVLDREYGNLRAALAQSIDRAAADGSPGTAVQAAVRLCRGLWRFWRHGAHLGEGRQWLDRVLAGPAGPADGDRAALLHAAAVLAATQDDTAAATRLGGQCLELAERTGDRPTAAQARNILGVTALRAGRLDEAADHFGFALAVWQELDEPRGTAVALGNLAKLALRRGAVADAAGFIDRCLELERAAGNSGGVLLGLECLADIRLAQADLPGAREAAAEALALSRELGDVFGEAMALHQQGLAARAGGDPAAATELITAALTLRHEVGDREDLAVSLDCVADLVVAVDPARATRLLAAAETLRSAQGLVAAPDVQARREAAVAAARAALGGPAFAEAWRAGRRATLDDAVAAARAPLPD